MTALERAIAEDLVLHPIFEGAEPQFIRFIAERATSVRLEEREILVQAAIGAADLILLVRGALQIEVPEGGDARGRVVTILKAPIVVGECELLHDRPRATTGVALNAVSALRLPGSLLESIFARAPLQGWRLYREVTDRLSTAIERSRHRCEERPERSVVRYLLALAEIFGTSELSISQVALGRATALRRETVNRVLRALVEAKRVSSSGRTLHLEIDALKEVLPPDDPPLVESVCRRRR